MTGDGGLREQFDADVDAIEAEYQYAKKAVEKVVPDFWERLRQAVDEA